MIAYKILLLSLISISSAARLSDSAKPLIEQKDSVGLRAFIRQIYPRKMTTEDWKSIKAMLAEYPNVGYDFILAWDRHPTGQIARTQSEEIDYKNEMTSGDAELEKNNFKSAFIHYQTAAKIIRTSYRSDVPRRSLDAYFASLHQMGRALYSMGKFNEALEVYSWIHQSYYQFKQIQFERMWAAFRAKRLDLAYGAIVSQQSAFFSKYVEPESYLLKYYILKKWCREKEAKDTLQEINKFKASLNSKGYSLEEWAKQDFYTLSLYRVLRPLQTNKIEKSFISNASRNSESAILAKKMKSMYATDVQRLKEQLEKVIGYALLIKSGGSKALENIEFKADDRSVLESKGFEFWTYKDGEEWADEIGKHIFVGGDICKK